MGKGSELKKKIHRRHTHGQQVYEKKFDFINQGNINKSTRKYHWMAIIKNQNTTSVGEDAG